MSVGGCRRINKVIVFDFCLITTSPSLFFCLGRSSYWLRPLFLSAMEKCPENAGKRQVAPKASAVLHYWFRLLTAPSRDRSPPDPNMEIIPFLSGSVRPIGLKTHQKPRKVLFRGHFFISRPGAEAAVTYISDRSCGNRSGTFRVLSTSVKKTSPSSFFTRQADYHPEASGAESAVGKTV